MGRPLALLAALLVVESVALLGRSSGGRSLYRPAALGAARGRIACLGSKPPAATGGVATHLVWFTGGADLRLHDHAGLSAAAKAGARVVPVFVLDDELVLGMPESTVRRLHSALAGLDGELEAAYGGRLVFRQGSAGKVLAELAREAKATVCHVIADEVTFHHKAARARARTALEKAGVETRLWTTCLRPDAPWSSAGAALTRLPGTYGEYFQTARTLDIAAPAPAPASVRICAPPKGGSLPACGAMLEATDARAGAAARARTAFPTTEPFDHVVSGWCTTRSARAALDEYVQIGRARFADRHFYEAMPLAPFAAPASNAAVAAELLAEPADAALDADAPAPARVGSAAQAAVAYTEADAERSELQRPGVRVGMAEGALETGVPVGPRASGVGSVEAVDRLVPVGSANAAELWAGATAADAAAVDGAAAAAAADYEPSFALAPPSLHAAAAQWVLPHVPRGGTPGGGDGAAERPEAGVVGGRLAAREVATRTLAPALSLGVLSAREVAHATLAAAAAAGGARSATLSGQAWGRSDLGALNDVLEWREWHRLLARRDLEVQRARAPGSKSGAAPLAEPDAAVAVAAGQSAADAVGADAQPPPPPQAQPASGAGAAARAAPPRVEAVAAIAAEVAAQARAGVEGLPPAARRDELAREVPAYGYWRWGGQHLIRFAVWPSDADVRALGGRADVGADGESLLEAERLLDALASEADAGAQPRAGADAEPALLFVHGFGASAEQWCRLARQTRAQMRALGMRVPRMYALDLIGFGHSEKPGADRARARVAHAPLGTRRSRMRVAIVTRNTRHTRHTTATPVTQPPHPSHNPVAPIAFPPVTQPRPPPPAPAPQASRTRSTSGRLRSSTLRSRSCEAGPSSPSATRSAAGSRRGSRPTCAASAGASCSATRRAGACAARLAPNRDRQPARAARACSPFWF
jgi:hypothetical protein